MTRVELLMIVLKMVEEMPIVHSSGKTMNKDYTITIQSTTTKCFPALIF